jgi:CubicO group peptidase (beta-lactamase class C family)
MIYPLAVGHRAKPGQKPLVVSPLPQDARLSPAGTTYSSVTEMARFANAFLNAGQLEGRLFIKEFNTEIALDRIGENRFAFRFPRALRPLEVFIGLGKDGQGPASYTSTSGPSSAWIKRSSSVNLSSWIKRSSLEDHRRGHSVES